MDSGQFEEGTAYSAIPNPHRAEISVDLLSRILRRAEITREDWLKHDR